MQARNLIFARNLHEVSYFVVTPGTPIVLFLTPQPNSSSASTEALYQACQMGMSNSVPLHAACLSHTAHSNSCLDSLGAMNICLPLNSPMAAGRTYLHAQS